jgi:hypothetical protein
VRRVRAKTPYKSIGLADGTRARAAHAESAKNADFSAIHSYPIQRADVDNNSRRSLYIASWRAAAAFGAVARAKPLTVFAVNEHPAVIVWP